MIESPFTPPPWWSYDAGRIQDWHIWQEVVVNDVYGFRGMDLRGKAVLDIGGHYGAAAWMATQAGAVVVHSYEPERETFAYLRSNAKRMPGVVAVPRAVGEVATNWFRAGVPVSEQPAAMPLDVAIGALAAESPTGRVALLKIDCEGGEWPAFSGATDLSLVDRIIGEWHRCEWNGRKWGPEDLAGMLGPHGFTVDVRDGEAVGMFFATLSRSPV